MKTVLGIVFALLLIGGGVWLLSNTASEYEVVVIDEVAALETELAALDNRVQNGELSPEAALVARTNIISRLDSINAEMRAAGSASLSNNQRQQLNVALNRLKRVLVTYSSTLDVIDTVAVADGRTSRSGGSLVSRFASSISTSEAVVAAEGEIETDPATEAALEEIVEDFPETVGEVADETELPENLLDDVSEDDTATATSSEEAEVSEGEDEEGTATDESADATETQEQNGTTTEMEAEAEAGVEIQ